MARAWSDRGGLEDHGGSRDLCLEDCRLEACYLHEQMDTVELLFSTFLFLCTVLCTYWEGTCLRKNTVGKAELRERRGREKESPGGGRERERELGRRERGRLSETGRIGGDGPGSIVCRGWFGRCRDRSRLVGVGGGSTRSMGGAMTADETGTPLI